MGVSFQRSHDITIETPPSAVYDYVCNPGFPGPSGSLPPITSDGEDRPLLRGETFRRAVAYQARRNSILPGRSLKAIRPSAWTVEADTDFIGKIVIRYAFEAVAGGTKYTRILHNPEPAVGAQRRADRRGWMRKR